MNLQKYSTNLIHLHHWIHNPGLHHTSSQLECTVCFHPLFHIGILQQYYKFQDSFLHPFTIIQNWKYNSEKKISKTKAWFSLYSSISTCNGKYFMIISYKLLNMAIITKQHNYQRLSINDLRFLSIVQNLLLF